MTGVLVGFSIIGFVIAVGWLLGRLGIVEQESRFVLNKVAFFAAGPALLFTVLSQADVSVLFSEFLLVTLCAFVVVALLYAVLARALLTRDTGRVLVGAFTSGYSNANNIGLPVAVYVIGDAQFAGPVLLLQLLVLSPLMLAALDLASAQRFSVRRVLTQPFRNPIVVAAAVGALVSVLGIRVPAPVLAPMEILGGAAVPLMLLAFGVSLGGERPLRPGSGRREIVLAVVLKVVVMPVVAYLLARFVFALPDDLVYAVVILAALPSAQNMYQYALRYRTGEVVARDAVLITTVLALPVMLLVAWLLRG
ncbi:AEC family transporter [Desertihabitans brevis]|uniref:AEC family transporter n=1 Tax=Desertihabitans brevis TaxID=2268447 RepID=A0A367YR36_9ACTN|nr:AEC family transporter [Desertihabitans brevis]RCK68009.1 AEC family transporter [Desertihabitans brevis]